MNKMKYKTALLLALCFICLSFDTKSFAADATNRSQGYPQGLSRLAGLPAESGGPDIPANAITIIDVFSPQVAGSKGRIAQQGRIKYLSLPPETEWTTALRPLRPGPNYTTFTMLASLDSVVSVGGALISLTKSALPGFATVMIGFRNGDVLEWKSLLHDVELRPYSGQLMGALAMVTVCTDTESRQWSIILGDRQVAYDLPLGTGDSDAQRVFSVKAGPSGAWLCGLASSDENPVFEDTNHNGVRDSFEKRILGELLDRKASRHAKHQLIELWKQRSYIEPSDYLLISHSEDGNLDRELLPAEYHLELPAYDQVPQADGRQIRGIPTSLILNR